MKASSTVPIVNSTITKRLTEKAIRRNLIWLQLFRFVYCFELTFTTIVLFFQKNDLNNTEIFWVYGALGGSGVLFEIPSGWMADRVGRKWSLLCGGMLMAGGFLIEALSHEFVTFLIANGLVGAGYSFVSGSDSALGFDSIKNSERSEEKQLKASKRFEIWGEVGTSLSYAAGSLIGVRIAEVNLRLTVWLQVPIYCLLIPIALLLKEAGKVEDAAQEGHKTIKGMLRTMKYALWENKQLRGFVFFFAAVGSFVDILTVMSPLYCQLAKISTEGMGWLMVASLVAMSLAALVAERYEKWLGAKGTWWSFVIIPGAGFALLATLPPSRWLLPIVVITMATSGISLPNCRHTMNTLATSEVRATILSVRSWAARMVFLATAWLVGRVTDGVSLQGAMIFSVVLYGTGGVVALIVVTRKITSD